MESLATADVWDLVAPQDSTQTFHCKSRMDETNEMNPSIDLRLTETSDSSSGVSSTSSGFESTLAALNCHDDLVQVEDILPFLNVPDAFFDSLLEDENEDDKPSEVAKTPKAPKDSKQRKKNSKLANSEREEAKKSLPPCNVCGAKSSGCHFGVITCESCKVFFRRSLTKTKSFSCYRKGRCEILPGNRSACQFCRLKKCQQVGMSKDGIKKGRYSLERKQDYQDLVEKLKSEEQEKEDEEKRQKEEDMSKIKETTERLQNLHDRHRLITAEVMENVRIAQQKKREYLKVMEEAMGPTPPISPDDATEFYKATGVDITGYKELAGKCSQNCPQRYCAAVIEYLKDMEEYKSLSPKDRVAVLKGGLYDWTWISQTELILDPDYILTCIFCGICLTPEQFGLFMTKEEVIRLFKPLLILNDLQLTDLEIAILRAFVFFDTSKCGELEEPDKVNQIQNHFLDCLLCVLEENRGASKAMKSFGHIIHAFTEMRQGKEANTEIIEKVAEIFPGELKMPKIIAEVYDLPDCLVDKLETDFSNLQLYV